MYLGAIPRAVMLIYTVKLPNSIQRGYDKFLRKACSRYLKAVPSSGCLADVRFAAHYGPKSDIVPCPKSAMKRHGPLFNHLVGSDEERGWKLDANCRCSLCIQDQLKGPGLIPRYLLNWLSPNNLIDLGRGISIEFGFIDGICNQTSGLCKTTIRIDCRNFCFLNKFNNEFAIREIFCRILDHERFNSLRGDNFEGTPIVRFLHRTGNR